MASNDEYRVGFCADGARDIKIRSNELLQTQGSKKKVVITQYVCNSYSCCAHKYRCKNSPELNTSSFLVPTIVEKK